MEPPANELPAQSRDFIHRYIASVEELEVLILFSRSSEEEWTIERVVEVVRSSSQSIRERVERLTLNGFLRKQPGGQSFRYSPNTPALAAEVQAVALIYKERPVKVIEQIFAKPSSSILGFADAFKIKKQQP